MTDEENIYNLLAQKCIKNSSKAGKNGSGVSS